MILELCYAIGVFRLLLFVYRLLRPFFYKKKQLFQRYGGGWVLVTGGSQGIGLGFCEQFAKENFNILMISRSQSKLQQAKQKVLKINPKIQVKTISKNFSLLKTVKQYEQLVSQFQDISVLVNNVGILDIHEVMKTPVEQLQKMITVNCIPIALLTRLLLPSLMKKKSAIINLSSSSASVVYTGMCNYASTKVFDDFFSRALSYEYPQVDIISVKPFYVRSSMTANSNSILHIDGDECARAVLNQLGSTNVTYGHWIHHFQGIVLESIPCFLRDLIVGTAVRNSRERMEKRQSQKNQ